MISYLIEMWPYFVIQNTCWKIYVVSWVLSIILLLSSWQTKIKADLKGLMFCMCCRYNCTMIIICTNLQLQFLWPICDLRFVVRLLWNYAFAILLVKSFSFSLYLSLSTLSVLLTLLLTHLLLCTRNMIPMFYHCFSFVCIRYHVIQSNY